MFFTITIEPDSQTTSGLVSIHRMVTGKFSIVYPVTLFLHQATSVGFTTTHQLIGRVCVIETHYRSPSTVLRPLRVFVICKSGVLLMYLNIVIHRI